MTEQTTQRHPTEINLHSKSRVLSIVFDDGHDTGIDSWDTLYSLGDNQHANWQGYLNKQFTEEFTKLHDGDEIGFVPTAPNAPPTPDMI